MNNWVIFKDIYGVIRIVMGISHNIRGRYGHKKIEPLFVHILLLHFIFEIC